MLKLKKLFHKYKNIATRPIPILERKLNASVTLNQNIEKLNLHLARFKNRAIQHRIEGENMAGGGSFRTISPEEKSTVCEVARGIYCPLQILEHLPRLAFHV